MTNQPERSSEVYSQGYEKWEGERTHFIPPWLLMGKTVLRNVLAPSGCLAWFVFLPFIVYVCIVYFQTFMTAFVHFQVDNLKDSEYFGFLADFVIQSGLELKVKDLPTYTYRVHTMIFCPLVMIFYGGQLISKDKASNALQVYFSKAISRTDYVLGKFFAIAVLTAMMTLVPGAIILLVGLFFNTDLPAYMAQAWYVPLLVGGHWVMLTLVYGSITLVFSSFFNKGYMAAVGIVGFLCFCIVFSMMASALFGAVDMLAGINWFMSTWHLGSQLYNLDVESWSLVIWRVFDLVAICGVAIFLIYRNINPVEVIK